MTEMVQDSPLSFTPERWFSVVERTNLAVAALGSLGLLGDKGLATDIITEQMQGLKDSLVDIDVPIEPFPTIELSDRHGIGFVALLDAFNTKQQYGTDIPFGKAWPEYNAKELNKRSVSRTIIQGRNTPGGVRAMLFGSNNSRDHSLYYDNYGYNQQRILAQGQELINPVDYIMINAQRREAGYRMLDGNTFTRFIQLHKKTAGAHLVPGARSYEGHVYWQSSDGSAHPNDGVRLSVG